MDVSRTLRVLLGLSVTFAGLYGCTLQRSQGLPGIRLPERIYERPAHNPFTKAKVGVFCFQSPVNAPRAGSLAADILYHKLLQKRIFHNTFSESGTGNLDLEDQVKIAQYKGYDLLITGRVLYYFHGSMFEASRVDERIRVIEVATGEAIWIADAVEIGRPILDSDLFLLELKGKGAPSPRVLMAINAAKFCEMFL